jgi:hypothetical protein
MKHLEITSPLGNSVVIAGRPVTFTAGFDSLGRAGQIVWSVASEPQKQTFGPSFTRQWAETGVDQVVASIDGLTCGIIVYVFKTQNGGDTIADLMSSAKPPVPRNVDAFPKLSARAQRLSA